MAAKVLSISYLENDERKIVKVNPNNGRFTLTYGIVGKYGSTRDVSRSFNLYRFVTHEAVRNADPVLTLNDGSKLRVYHGGAASQMIAIAAGVIERHDSQETLKKNLLEKAKKKALKMKGESKDSDVQEKFLYTNFHFDYPADWDEDY